MARPCKSAKLLTEYSQTKTEINQRIENESKLKGCCDKIMPPEYLSANQQKLFRYIVSELENSEILGNLDVYILATCVIAIDRLQTIEAMINTDINLLSDKNIMSAKEKYTKDLYRCCNELSLSPQSRAKMANINLQKSEENPLLKVLNDEE